MPNPLLFSWRNSNIYKSDYELAKRPRVWWNDSLITFAFDYAQHKYVPEEYWQHNLLISPLTTFMLLHEDDTGDLRDAIDGVGIDEDTKSLLFAINDNASMAAPGGSHWSLLHIDVKNHQAYHYDSLYDTSNHYQLAQQLCDKVTPLLPQPFTVGINRVECAQQRNSYDCGVYVCLFADWIAAIYSFKGEGENCDAHHADVCMYEAIGKDGAKDFRASLAAKIDEIRQLISSSVKQ